MLTVVTGWSPQGYEEYGRAFAESFAKHWPANVDLIVYGEEPVPLPRGEFRRLDQIPGCVDFLDRHRHNAKANGREPKPDWKPAWRELGYNFRWDAWKFCRQGFIPHHAAQTVDGMLCWLDGDVVTFKDVPENFIESLLPDGKDVAYLGRAGAHSEIGFQLYRLPQAMPMLERFRDYYDTDAVFLLKEWHSAYVFDTARQETKSAAHDLTPGGTGHVWCSSPLFRFLDHLKGRRKDVGASRERTIAAGGR